MASEPKLMTLSAAAEYLGVPRASLYHFASMGEVASVRPATPGRRGRGRYYFLRSDLDAWIDARRRPAFAVPDLIEMGLNQVVSAAPLKLPAVRRFS